MLLFSSKHSWLTVAVRNLGGVWQQAAACNCQVSAVIETVYELWGILIRAQLHGMTPIQGARAIVQTRTAANLWLEYINLTDSQKCTFHVSSNQITWWLQCMEYAKGGSNVESETLSCQPNMPSWCQRFWVFPLIPGAVVTMQVWLFPQYVSMKRALKDIKKKVYLIHNVSKCF